MKMHFCKIQAALETLFSNKHMKQEDDSKPRVPLQALPGLSATQGNKSSGAASERRRHADNTEESWEQSQNEGSFMLSEIVLLQFQQQAIWYSECNDREYSLFLYKQISYSFEFHHFLDLCFQYFPVLHDINKCIHIFSGNYSNISHLK